MGTLAIVACAVAGALAAVPLRGLVTRYARDVNPEISSLRPGPIEVATGLLVAACAWRFGISFETLAYSALATITVPLAALDFMVQRLPNSLVGATYVALALPLAVEALISPRLDNLARALLSMLIALGVHGILYAVGGIAGGDLKLAGSLGLALGWLSWPAVWTGFALGWILGGLAVVVLRFTQPGWSNRHIPLGPFLISGSFATVLVLAP